MNSHSFEAEFPVLTYRLSPPRDATRLDGYSSNWWSFVELSVPAFAPIYNTLARPHFEHAMQVCSPNLAADADCLEQIQRLATRLVKGFHRLPYEERLYQLGLLSLNRRRRRGDPIAAYKVSSGEQYLDLSIFFYSASEARLEG